MVAQIPDPEVQRLAVIADRLEHNYLGDNAQWDGSRFAWIKGGLPSRRKGVVFEELVASWCLERGLTVNPPPNTESDRIIGGLRTEIKGSTLWQGGNYRFQQIRDQDYQVLLCLGISPFDVHCWVLPKREVMRLWEGGQIVSQHGGAQGTDTAWLSVDPGDPPDWLRQFGGTLIQGFERLQAEMPRR